MGRQTQERVTTMLCLKCHSAPVGTIRVRGQSEGTGFAWGRGKWRSSLGSPTTTWEPAQALRQFKSQAA